MTIRSKPMLDSARDQACVNCGQADGTVVAAHYTGMRAPWFGKGKAIKGHDFFVADLCHRCHSAFDQYKQSARTDSATEFQKKIDLSEQFLFLVCKTLLRRVDQGVIHIKGMRE
jgi:hypothetical protein